jgi:bifunctional non-homologous end joining protein LigD
LAQGLEGVVAKRRLSRYRPGERSGDWIKIKVWAQQDVAVIGWLPRQGSTSDLGSLVVAVMGPRGLVHAGQVGSGLDAKTRRELLAALAADARPDSPIPGAAAPPEVHWVEPRVVVRVEFAEWTPDGLLRQPTFVGTVVDRGIESTVREDPVRRVPAGTARGAASPAAPAAPGAATSVTPDELAALDAMEKEGLWEIGGQAVRVTNLDKVLFPAGEDTGDQPVTKRDLALLRHRGLCPGAAPSPSRADAPALSDGIATRGSGRKVLPSHTPPGYRVASSWTPRASSSTSSWIA